MSRSGAASPLLALSVLLVVHGAFRGPELLIAQDLSARRARVFVECNGDACDEDHLQREIAYVDWVRDRFDADVEVLVTEEATGAGGTRYALSFTGRPPFEGMDDVLGYTRNPTDTDGEARDGLTRTLAAGLMRYAARTQSLEQVAISYEPAAETGSPTTAEEDPWHRWVFRSGFGASLQAEDRTKNASYYGTQSISRVTEGMKLALDVAGEYTKGRYDTSDTTTVTSVTQEYTAEFLYVESVGSHWGVGLRASAANSTYRNYDLVLRLAPAVEYNIFPYEESTRRQLRIQYAVGPRLLRYTEETVYFKTKETRFHQSLSVSLDVEERWGSALAALEGSNYMDDPSKNRLEGYGFLQLRIVRGLGFFVEGSLARVRDQISLARGDATPEEVLLRQRELRTDFRFEGRVGFDFTFGSIFSDVVNARFGS